MKEEICVCGHSKACHIDLMKSLNQTLKNNKETLVYIPCLIYKCDCETFKRK